MWVSYEANLSIPSLRDGGNSCYILVGTVLIALHGAVLCKIWH